MLRRLVLIASVAAALALGACEREPEPPPQRVKQVFHLNPYEKDFGYSQAVLIDKTLYISGSWPPIRTGVWWHRAIWPANARRLLQYTSHARRARSRLRRGREGNDLYDRHGRLAESSDLRFEYYDKERLPTTSWVQVQRLVDPGFLVEIEVVAELP